MDCSILFPLNVSVQIQIGKHKQLPFYQILPPQVTKILYHEKDSLNDVLDTVFHDSSIFR